MLICHLSYEVDPTKLLEFEQYARAWVRLIERYGGTHMGYFVATEAPEGLGFSFPGRGRSGRSNAAFALFSFADLAAYEAYRRAVRLDPDCEAAEDLFKISECFLSYERTFVRHIGASSPAS